MNVLSLFDGISCGQIAFEKLGVTFGNTAERERERERESRLNYYRYSL